MDFDFEELSSLNSIPGTPEINPLEDGGVEETKESEPIADPFQTPQITAPVPTTPPPAPGKRSRGKPEMLELAKRIKQADAERRTDTRKRVLCKVSLLNEADLKKLEVFIQKVCAKRYCIV